MRENGRISKVGTAFVFILLLLIYQVISGTEVSTYLVELLFVIFTAELGTKFLDNKFISDSKMIEIKQNLSKQPDTKKQSMSAKNIDDIDFDEL